MEIQDQKNFAGLNPTLQTKIIERNYGNYMYEKRINEVWRMGRKRRREVAGAEGGLHVSLTPRYLDQQVGLSKIISTRPMHGRSA